MIARFQMELSLLQKRNNSRRCSPFAVYLNADDKMYLEPDVFVVCDKDKLDDK